MELFCNTKTARHSLSSSLVLVEQTILSGPSLQKPHTDQTEPFNGHVRGGGRRCCSLRNPAAIWQQDEMKSIKQNENKT